MTKDSSVKEGLELWRQLGIVSSVTPGSKHYHQEVQPIELIASNEALEGFCIGSIIKYASRYHNTQNNKDLIKIVDYAQILLGYKTIQEVKTDVDNGQEG